MANILTRKQWDVPDFEGGIFSNQTVMEVWGWTEPLKFEHQIARWSGEDLRVKLLGNNILGHGQYLT